MRDRRIDPPGLIRGINLPALVVCFSAANLLFMKAWFELFPGTTDQYLFEIAPTPQALAAVWASLLSLTVILYLGDALARRTGWHVPAALVSWMLVLASLRRPILLMAKQYPHLFNREGIFGSLNLRGIGLLVGLGCLGLFYLAYRHQEVAYRLVRNLLLVLSPIPLLFSWTILRSMHGPTTSLHPARAESTPGVRPPRVVILIFDEWDYEYAFTHRPDWIRLPEIDRFSREYGSYSNCWPPAGETLRSIPSLATGKFWLGAKPGAHLELFLKDPGSGTWVAWSETDSLFKSIAKKGWHAKMIQSWHVFSDKYRSTRPGLSISHYMDLQGQTPEESYRTFRGSLSRVWAGIPGAFVDYFRLVSPENPVPARVDMAERMIGELVNTLGQRQYDLIWAHLPFPHVPAVINARTGAFLGHPEPGISNLDNMVLVDRTLGLVRTRLERQGDWDGSLIILTADHWQRERVTENIPPNPAKYAREDGMRVPLLVKWPHQTQAWSVNAPVSNVSIRRMVEAVAAGETHGESFPMTPPPADIRGVLLHNATR